MEQIKPQDAQFLYTETDDNYNHITLVLNFDGPSGPSEKTVDCEELIAFIQKKLSPHPIYSHRLVRLPAELDYPYWLDDEEFEPDAHFSVIPLPAPGDWPQLRSAISALHSRPMGMNHPLWDVTIFTGVNSNGQNPNGFSIVIRLHHVAIDGIGIIKLLFNLAFPLTEEEACIDQTLTGNDYSLPWATVAKKVVSNRFRHSLDLSGALLKSTSFVKPSMKRYLKTKPSERQRVYPNRFNASVAGDKIFDVISVELKSLIALRSLYKGATVNDVVLSICAGALRRYLEEHGELSSHSLVAWVPVNARSGNGAETGNNLSAFTAPIYSNIADPRVRLEKIVEATKKGKGEISSTGILLSVTKCLPATEQYLFAKAINATSAASSTCNLFVSNVAGPPQPINIAGHRLESVSGLPPLGEGMGLFIATPSYNGKLYFNVISTETILPDIAFFMECIQASFAEMEALI